MRQLPWADLDDFPEAFFVLPCAAVMHTGAAAKTMSHVVEHDEVGDAAAADDDDCSCCCYCPHSVLLHGEGWLSHHGAAVEGAAATRRQNVLRACS